MRTATALTAGFAICILTAAYGCGGGSSELSKTEFVEQANSICVRAKKELNKKAKVERGPAYFVNALIDALRTEADEIDSLGPPDADAEQIDKIVESARQAAAAIEENEKEFAKAASQAAKAQRMARAYGLDACLIT